MALIPLRTGDAQGFAGTGGMAGAGEVVGLLVLGSPDPTRYSAEMGTEFLTRIGEVASAGLTRLLPLR